jgi:hypothetical protein
MIKVLLLQYLMRLLWPGYLLYLTLAPVIALTTMKHTRDDGLGGQGMTLTPSSGTYSKVVFWFHGLGDTADGWGSMSKLY